MSDDEENRLSARAARYVRVGANVGGLAAKAAGQRLFGLERNDAQMAGDLAAALGGLKGPIMKVAQLLSTIPEALPKEYAAELSQLQSQAPPMGPADAENMAIGLSWNDWLGGRDAQSMAFLRAGVSEKLYSGLAMSTPSASLTSARKRLADSGSPASKMSWLNSGMSPMAVIFSDVPAGIISPQARNAAML